MPITPSGGGSGVNFSTLVYGPAFDMFARPVTFYPYVSQPAGGSYLARGIFSTRSLDVVGLDGAIFSDQQTILDIREVEFSVLPLQLDRCYIGPADAGPAEGEFEITNASTNGGGETTLVLRKWLPPAP
jgi:hypothetical protein